MGNLMSNKTAEELESILTAIESLVKTTPNDQDLGRLVRKLISSTKDGFITID
jgi:hypothetical protein